MRDCRHASPRTQPPNGQKKLLLVLGAMLGISVVIAVIATFASP